ncbi:5-hydroxytryptamine receptor 3A-like isoform X2 [Stigmatopora nigra]
MSVIRPVTKLTTTTNISFYFMVYGILGVNEKAQLLTTYLWQHFIWQNELVSWDPVQCGTDMISLPREKFWVPDLIIREFMDQDKAPIVPYLKLHSNGLIQDAKPSRVVSSCNLDIYTFPFDTQECTLTYTSQMSFASDMKVFSSMSDDVLTAKSKSVMTTLGEWELLRITAVKPSDQIESESNQLDMLQFHIQIRRRSTLYVVNLLLPSSFLITVDLFSFLLPPQSVDRSAFKVTLILGYTVFLLIMNDLLPITGNTIPIINVFLSLCLALMVASLLETILITKLLLTSKNVRPVPRWIKVLVLHILGRLVGLPWKETIDSESRTKGSSVSAHLGTDGDLHEEIRPAGEKNALRELRSLSEDLKVLRLQVEEQLSSTQGSKGWIQHCLLKAKPSLVLFIFICLFNQASCNSILQNCSSPDTPALLEALRPVFELKAIRPVMNVSIPTALTVDFVIFGILGVDEKAQILTTFVIQILFWKNEFITWDPNECSTRWLVLPRKLLWIPDIIINEFMEKNTVEFAPYTVVYYHGMVLDMKPIRVVSSCRLDIYTFPFDIQNCTLTFNSFIYDFSALRIGRSFSTQKIFDWSKGMMATLGEWELIGIKSSQRLILSSNNQTYEELCFFVSLRRRPMLYVVNLLIPSCFLITVDLFSFLLPPQKVDRSLFKMTLILGYIVFLMLMNDMLPITGNTIPLINVFLSLSLALMVVSLLETTFITNLLHSSKDYSEVPYWIRLVFIHVIGRMVLLPPKKKIVEQILQNPGVLEMTASTQRVGEGEVQGAEGPLDQDEAVEVLRSLGRDLRVIRKKLEGELNVSQSAEEWNQVGFIIDRTLFSIYIIFLSVSLVSITVIWVDSYNQPHIA